MKSHTQQRSLPQQSRWFQILLVALICLSSSNNGVLSFSTPNRGGTKSIMKMVETSSSSSLGTKGPPTPSSSGSNIPPGSPLAMICLDQQEFELEVGHAMDVLRTDYPMILTTKPDFSIYDQDLELIDPSGVQLHGVKNYKAAFRLLHAVVGIFYSPDQSILKNRMCFDKARQNIRIHWNAEVIPKAIFGGQKSTLHVDGISVYEISRVSGNITQHRIERLVINDTPVVPEQGVFAALRGYYNKKSDMEGIPVWNSGGLEANGHEVVPFRTFSPTSTSVLFHRTDEASFSPSQLGAASPDSSSDTSAVADPFTDAFEKKNAARKKFGLEPLSLEEFAELQEQVEQLGAQQQQRSATAAAEVAAKKKKEERGGFFKKIFGDAMQDTCESNFDCQRPEVCCDFGFKKMCCSSGMRVLDGPPRSRQGQLAEVPVIANPGPNYPPLDYPPRY
eukprot:CAMPEP_0113625460 /NCGR_PEP_ID=MMETSP0017_2-20120614/13154_1 /TAXON_ID=2856 /ORGANISM="Cylindrotheca closterium" /LENGTH=447 /DNA_ID=CAMNT_0000535581 /DNA_START=169 /DNA_END=1512 /DNA_ORIENTATION=- /assembly_acc=CAM_ASM_000147